MGDLIERWIELTHGTTPEERSKVPCTLLFVLRFAASGWNGVLVAEVARLAGSHQAGEITGRVLAFGYLRLALAPGAFAWIAGSADTRNGFVCLFMAAGTVACCLIAAKPGETVT